MMTPEEREEFEKQIKADNTQMEEIKKAYGAFLQKQGIHYSDHQGFYVRIPLENTDTSFTHVCDIRKGKILLGDYCGNCISDLDTAVDVADAIREKCPDARIDVERYSSYQLTLYHEIKYQSIEDLHKHVLRMAEIVDIGAGIAKEMLGDGFER